MKLFECFPKTMKINSKKRDKSKIEKPKSEHYISLNMPSDKNVLRFIEVGIFTFNSLRSHIHANFKSFYAYFGEI